MAWSTKTVKFERGDWQVTRLCCTSGMCLDCHERGKRARIVHADRVSETWAKHVATNWKAYDAKAEPMVQP